MRKLLLSLVLLILPLSLGAQQATSGGYRSPNPRAVANGGIRYWVTVNDSLVAETLGTQHTAAARATAEKITCYLLNKTPCDVEFGTNQSWRIELDMIEVQRPIDPPPSPAPELQTFEFYPQKVRDGHLLDTPVGDSLEFYVVAVYDGMRYVCEDNGSERGGRRVVVEQRDTIRTVTGWAPGSAIDPRTVTGACDYTLSSDNPTVMSVQKRWGTVMFERLRQGFNNLMRRG